MIRLHVRCLAHGKPFMIMELRCDGCNRRGAGPIGDGDPLNLFVLRTQLRVTARLRRGWDAVTVLEPDGRGGQQTHRIDRCRTCQLRAVHTARPDG